MSVYDEPPIRSASLHGGERLRSEYVLSLIHELGTPLTAIRSLSEILRDNPDMAVEERTRFLNLIVAETERLSRLIAREADTGMIGMEEKVAPQYGEVDLPALISHAVELMAPLFNARGIAIELRMADAIPCLYADSDGLSQVMCNLLSNAAAFAPAKTGRVRIFTRCPENQVEITVEDNGAGIAPDDLPFIFEQFQRGMVCRHGTGMGMGLGLAISRRIVERMGGKVQAVSAPGCGAVFTVTLPLSGKGKC